MKAMESLEDLIEEVKVRTLWWALCIFGMAYFLTHTSKSMWMNLPISILFVYALRILFNEVEFRRKVTAVRPQTYLSHLEKKQLSVNDSRLVCATLPSRWKRKIDSPIVEAAMKDFIDKILKDFVVDLWYSEITPDTEFPEQIRSIIMDALGEVTGRVKEMNLVDLLMRDLVDLVGDHLDLFRRNQAAIGVDVMGILSSEERDERLKHHLMTSRELHPALLSPESEYKVLQRLTSGVLAVVLRPRETQCPVVRSIARELLTSLVMQPILDFASPGYINELIEYVLLATKVDSNGKEAGNYHSKDAVGIDHNHSIAVRDDNSNKRKYSSINQGADYVFHEVDNQLEKQPSHAEWARMLDVATKRRTEVLMPENLENMWTKGRNYKKKENKSVKLGVQESISKDLTVKSGLNKRDLNKDILITLTSATGIEADLGTISMPGKSLVPQLSSPLGYGSHVGMQSSINPLQELVIDRVHLVDNSESNRNLSVCGRTLLKRSNSTSALRTDPGATNTSTEGEGTIISEFYTPNFGRPSEGHPGRSASDMVVRKEGQLVPKLRCRVMGAYFEKLGSKSFAVYSIAVTDAEKRNWFVKRRYRNFERLHRYLKDIPNYTLHLPPKRIFSSSTEDTFVHQRCIQLDKYLLDMLSIANVAEQHEVWDFLSASSKNYSFGKSSSVMRTLAVNVDDAVDDIVRQFKGVSDGLIRKVVGSPSPAFDASSSISDQTLSLNPDDLNQHISRHYSADVANSYSDNEEDGKDQSNTREDVSGWHSDTELNTKSFPPRVVKRVEENRCVHSDKKLNSGVKYGISQEGVSVTSYDLEDVGVPPEWTPPNVSVPLLNLVDKIFQLNRRGWIRRQVLWISKQILQLIMEDALDDWLLRQIHWLRRDDIIAEGIRWVQDILWPDGTFFLRLRDVQCEGDDTKHDKSSFQTTSQPGGSKFSKPGSFEEQLEAARRASAVKKLLFGGAPTTLVSLIGHKQYKRCAKDIYYFTQSTVCVKQLAFGILELLLISIFPELRNLVLELHEKMHVPQPV